MFVTTPSRTTLSLAFVAAVAMTCLQGAAFAAEAPAPRSVEIDVAGLNLASPDVQAALDARIRRAARQACNTASYRDLGAMRISAQCEADAIAAASARRDLLAARAQGDRLAAR